MTSAALLHDWTAVEQSRAVRAREVSVVELTAHYLTRTSEHNDAIGALRAGTPDGVGVAITCGTGIAIGARNHDGREWYSGNWEIATGGEPDPWPDAARRAADQTAV